MSERRKFIKQSIFGSIGIIGLSAYPLSVLAKDEMARLTILHTNDVHSHIDPFPENDPKYPGLGGAARRASMIKQIRKEEDNVLVFDAGDIFQGTPYFNKYKGEIDFKVMNEMGYDAATIGNHDFDNGVEGLAKMTREHADFDFLSANYDFSDTPMNNLCSPYKIYEFDNLKIGVLGVGVQLKGLVNQRFYGETKYLDPLHISEKTAKFLRNEKDCSLIVCLSHLGFDYRSKKISDLILAKNTTEIDIIIGGHTHTFLDKPVFRKNKKNKEVMICQAGWAGIRLGRIDCTFSRFENEKKLAAHTLNIFKNQ